MELKYYYINIIICLLLEINCTIFYAVTIQTFVSPQINNTMVLIKTINYIICTGCKYNSSAEQYYVY